MIFVLDNYDSFTYNLVQLIGQRLSMACGEEVEHSQIVVRRNNLISVEEIIEMKPSHIVISPGPGHPDQAGVSVSLIRRCIEHELPLLGVCLGHQALAVACGAVVCRAEHQVHGKSSKVYHDNSSLFQGLSNPFEAARYHSLIVKEETLPAELSVSAWTSQGEIMSLRHHQAPVWGVQFHPESILTGEGKRLIQNFLDC